MRNPLAPAAWIPLGNVLYQIYIPASMGCLSILTWDILQYLPEEIELLYRRRFTIWKLCYLIARVAPLLFMISHAILFVREHADCQPWVTTVSTMYALTNICTGLLFLLRVKAVYNNHKWLRWFLTFAWALHAVSTIFNFIGSTGVHIEPTNYCFVETKGPFLAIMFFIQAGYEVLVCVAITYKLSLDGDIGELEGESKPLRSWCSLWVAKNPFTRLRARFLQDSQVYFLIALFVKISQILIYFFGHPVVILLSGLLDIAIIGILGAKIYRKFSLGRPGIMSGPFPTVGTLGA